MRDPVTTFNCLPFDSTFTPAVVTIMLAALSAAQRILAEKGVRPDVVAESAIREILAKGIIRTAQMGERDSYRLRDAAVAHYMEQSPLI